MPLPADSPNKETGNDDPVVPRRDVPGQVPDGTDVESETDETDEDVETETST